MKSVIIKAHIYRNKIMYNLAYFGSVLKPCILCIQSLPRSYILGSKLSCNEG